IRFEGVYTRVSPRRWSMRAFLLGLLLLFPSSAQNADAPGRVIGRVLIRGENTPVSGARVMLMSVRRAPTPPNSGPPAPPPQVMTGFDGVFTFDRVAPGEYRINAQ